MEGGGEPPWDKIRSSVGSKNKVNPKMCQNVNKIWHPSLLWATSRKFEVLQDTFRYRQILWRIFMYYDILLYISKFFEVLQGSSSSLGHFEIHWGTVAKFSTNSDLLQFYLALLAISTIDLSILLWTSSLLFQVDKVAASILDSHIFSLSVWGGLI